MPITRAKTAVLNIDKDISINGIDAGVGRNNIPGGTSTMFGSVALASNINGSSNTAIGASTLTFLTSGFSCTAVGENALNNTNGSENSGFGALAGMSLTIGSENTAIGWAAMDGSTTVNNSSALGYGALVTGSNQVQLGDSRTTTFAFGAVQNRSDIRDKADVRNTELGLDFIKALRPVDFKWDMRDYYRPIRPAKPSKDATEEEKAKYQIDLAKWIEDVKLENITHDGSKKRNRFHHGLIAQEVKAVLDEKGIDFGGFQDHKIAGGDDVLSIGYGELIAPMIKAIQELSAEIASLKAQLNP